MKRTSDCLSEAEWLKERKKDITSTEVAALFSASPYWTKFSLWHSKKGNYEHEVKETERTWFGKAMQGMVAKEACERLEDTLEHVHLPPADGLIPYSRIEGLRIGSSIDHTTTWRGKQENVLIEVKCVDYYIHKQTWIEDQPPAHIQFQCQHQMLVTGIDHLLLAVFIGGNHLRTIMVEKDEKIHEEILKRCAAFWKTVDNNEEPDPEEVDADVIVSMNQACEPGLNLLDASNVIPDQDVLEYSSLGKEIKELEKKRKYLKAMILRNLGNYATAQGNNWKISTSTVEGKEISYVREPYRTFRVTVKKEK